MLDHDAIAALIPHAGAMVLLHQALRWDARTLAATALSHTRADNPLRAHGRLAPICGCEYGLQAAALHGALRAAAPQPPGRVVALRLMHLTDTPLDRFPDPLDIEATRHASTTAGAIYGFTLRAGPTLLLHAEGTIAFPPPPGA